LRNLSTFHEALTGRHWPWNWICIVLGLACTAVGAHATESNKAISQYVHDHWGIERGFPSGPIYAITQTPDGYLWVGSEKGLIRFDGLNFRLFQQSFTPAGPIGPVLGLVADAEGNLWVRQQGPKLLRYRDGKFEDFSMRFLQRELAITAMTRGKDGEALFAGLLNGIFAYSGGRFTKLASMPRMSNFLAISLAETADGRILVGTRDTGLFQLKDGLLSQDSRILSDRKINAILPVSSTDWWIGTDGGLVRWNGKETVSNDIPPSLLHTQILTILRDRQSNTWVGTEDSLYRIDSSGVSSVDQMKRSAGDAAITIFQGREGNIWTGSTEGLDRLRDTVFTTYAVPEGLPSNSNGPVFVDSEGRTWFAPSQGGLNWLKDGTVGRVTTGGLDQDVVYSISGGNGELWLGTQRDGLVRLRFQSGSAVTETFTQAQGLAQNSVYAVHRNHDGTVWAATLSAGLSRFKDGKFTSFSSDSGLLSDSVASIAEGTDGTMWFATSKGLSAFSNGQWRSFTARDGLPSEDVTCLLQDSFGVLWLGTSGGLAAVRSGTVSIPQDAPDSLREPILGLEQDRDGGLWIASVNHVLRVDRDNLAAGKLAQDDAREFGIADGLRATEGVKRSRSVVADPSGGIWFSLNRGLSHVYAARAKRGSPPALVHLEGVFVDGEAIPLQKDLRIPGGHQRVTFSFAGVTLSVPERVRFKYMLEGFDHGWSQPIADREVSYTNLDAGPYRFRLMASNSDGLWNSAELTEPFEIEPVFWRTWWFRASAILAVALAVFSFFRLRVLRLTSQMNMRFEERLAERTRISQELHDTLLQGFLSASMQLHVVSEQIPEDSPAKPLLARVIQMVGSVIEEGRNVVRGLRSANQGSPDLEQAFSQIRLLFPVQSNIDFRVIVDGTPRQLRSGIRDEVYLIGHEALSNAFRHARASQIEVEIEYGSSYFRVLVRDNGGGIDTHVLQSGRDGHFGLAGMKERTERIGAKLRILSRVEAGTEVELSVPADIAYVPGESGRAAWISKLHSRKAKEADSHVEKESIR
jgi:signal transduction histidine kinase/ligand-binding sensor domain-containing protein